MTRVVVRAGLTIVSVGLFIATLVHRDWIEAVFHVDPDGGNGSAEWLVVAIFAGAAIGFGTLTAREWRRVHSVQATA